MNMDDNWWINWFGNEATEDERYLVERAFTLDEDYFGDMTFEPGSSTYSLIQCKSKSEDEEEWHEDRAPLPDELEYFQSTWFHYKVVPANEINGRAYFSPSDQTLCVGREHLDDDAVILHELIHLHEYVINELPFYFHDIIYWALYQDLKTKIPKLDEIITTHAHALNEYGIYRSGGLHDVLFLLKSFDLDIKKNYPLGTVFAYGYENDLAEYKYIPEKDCTKNQESSIQQTSSHNIIAKAEKDADGNMVFTNMQQEKSGTILFPVNKSDHRNRQISERIPRPTIMC